MEKYLELGRVNNTHGIKGEVKFELWCDDISYLKQLKTVYLDKKGNESLTLSSARPQKNNAILKFEEITSIDLAEKLKGKVLYCDRDDAEIDDGAYYLADIIGCRVINAENKKEYGKVCDIMNYGSCDIFDVKNGKKHSLIPATPDIIAAIDLENGVIEINEMKGLFDEN